jgi:hypothetical protein
MCMYIIYYWNVTRKHGSFLYNSKAKTSHERRCMKFRPTNLFRLGLKNGWRVFGVCPNSHSTGRSFHRVFPCWPDKKIDSDTHTHTHIHKCIERTWTYKDGSDARQWFNYYYYYHHQAPGSSLLLYVAHHSAFITMVRRL